MSRVCTAGEIAAHVGAILQGDAALGISGVASPVRAGPHDLIFLAADPASSTALAARRRDLTLRSAAQCVVAAPEVQLPGKTVLRAGDPKLAFARAADLLRQRASDRTVQKDAPARVHATAVVAPSARLGPGVVVGPYVVIEEEVEIGAGTEVGAFGFIGQGARLGENCRLDPRVTLYAGARLGNRVVIHSGGVVGSEGFGYVYGEGRYWKFPQVGQVELGDEVELGSNTTVDRGSLEATTIGAGTKIDNLVQVAHNVRIGRNTVIAAQTGISGSSEIGSNVVIGGQAGFGEHCRVEDGAIIGGQSGVLNSKTVRAGQTVWGTPARPLAKFKQQHAWLARLPQLIARLRAGGP